MALLTKKAKNFLPSLTPVIGVDLGTSRTRIWQPGRGVVIDQPSLIATDTVTQKVVAIGQDAVEMKGRVQSQIEFLRPLQAGKIYDSEAVVAMLQLWLQKILGWRYLFSPIVMVSVPASLTQASRQAVIETFYQLGAREVYTVAQPLAAAIGAGVPIADVSGTLIFYLGAGVVEAGVISLGSLVTWQSSTQAGDYLDKLFNRIIVEKYQAKIGGQSLRSLKHKLLLLETSSQTQRLVAQHTHTRESREVVIKAQDLVRPTLTVIEKYKKLLQALFASIDPELTTDILDKGMLMTGGLAQLTGLDGWLANQLHIPTTVVDDPDQVVIEGIKTALQNLEEFRHSFGYQA